MRTKSDRRGRGIGFLKVGSVVFDFSGISSPRESYDSSEDVLTSYNRHLPVKSDWSTVFGD